jgi:hypothetical protein
MVSLRKSLSYFILFDMSYDSLFKIIPTYQHILHAPDASYL